MDAVLAWLAPPRGLALPFYSTATVTAVTPVAAAHNCDTSRTTLPSPSPSVIRRPTPTIPHPRCGRPCTADNLGRTITRDGSARRRFAAFLQSLNATTPPRTTGWTHPFFRKPRNRRWHYHYRHGCSVAVTDALCRLACHTTCIPLDRLPATARWRF